MQNKRTPGISGEYVIIIIWIYMIYETEIGRWNRLPFFTQIVHLRMSKACWLTVTMVLFGSWSWVFHKFSSFIVLTIQLQGFHEFHGRYHGANFDPDHPIPIPYHTHTYIDMYLSIFSNFKWFNPHNPWGSKWGSQCSVPSLSSAVVLVGLYSREYPFLVISCP